MHNSKISSVHSRENMIYMHSTVIEENEKKAMKRERRWRKGKKKKGEKGVSSAADGRTENKVISV